MGMAAQGLRDIGDGAETIVSRDELARVKRQARKVMIYSLLTAALATGLFVAIR